MESAQKKAEILCITDAYKSPHMTRSHVQTCSSYRPCKSCQLYNLLPFDTSFTILFHLSLSIITSILCLDCPLHNATISLELTLLIWLLAGICMVNQLVCLVIDEAHRASRNYAYCVVVREVYLIPKQSLLLVIFHGFPPYQAHLKKMISVGCK